MPDDRKFAGPTYRTVKQAQRDYRQLQELYLTERGWVETVNGQYWLCPRHPHGIHELDVAVELEFLANPDPPEPEPEGE